MELILNGTRFTVPYLNVASGLFVTQGEQAELTRIRDLVKLRNEYPDVLALHAELKEYPRDLTFEETLRSMEFTVGSNIIDREYGVNLFRSQVDMQALTPEQRDAISTNADSPFWLAQNLAEVRNEAVRFREDDLRGKGQDGEHPENVAGVPGADEAAANDGQNDPDGV
ncbi:MAG TPA: hypothetical protein VHI13_16830 [Candidatus Kapabacteria bacterium]|nr:hypothetical protein [Candidatus Kapabacteria bacterium]